MSIIANATWATHRNSRVGPFEYSGALYMVGRYGLYQSVDGGMSWALKIEFNWSIGGQDCVLIENTLYIAGTMAISTFSNGLRVDAVNLDTDTTVSTSILHGTRIENVSGTFAYFLAVLSNGDYVAFRQDVVERIMGTDYRRIAYSVWNGSSWTTTTPAFQTGAVHYDVRDAVLGTDNRVHMFLNQSNAIQPKVFTRNSNGTITALTDFAAHNNLTTVVGNYPLVSGRAADDVVLAYSFGTSLRAARAPSSNPSSPSVSTIATTTPRINTSNPAALVYDNAGVLHAFYVRNDNGNIEYVNDQGIGTWTTPESLLADDAIIFATSSGAFLETNTVAQSFVPSQDIDVRSVMVRFQTFGSHSLNISIRHGSFNGPIVYEQVYPLGPLTVGEHIFSFDTAVGLTEGVTYFLRVAHPDPRWWFSSASAYPNGTAWSSPTVQMVGDLIAAINPPPNTQGISAGLIDGGNSIGVLYNDAGTVRFATKQLAEPDPITQAPTLSSPSKTTTSISLSWTSVGANTYELQRNEVTVQNTSALTRNDTDLTHSTSYSYRVRGVNSVGPGPWSNVLSVTTDAPPSISTLVENFNQPLDPAKWSFSAGVEASEGVLKMEASSFNRSMTSQTEYVFGDGSSVIFQTLNYSKDEQVYFGVGLVDNLWLDFEDLPENKYIRAIRSSNQLIIEESINRVDWQHLLTYTPISWVFKFRTESLTLTGDHGLVPVLDNLNYIPDAPAISLHQATETTLRITVPDTSPAHRFELELNGVVVDSFAEAYGTSPTRYVEFTGLAGGTSYDVRVRYLGGYWSAPLTASTAAPPPSISTLVENFNQPLDPAKWSWWGTPQPIAEAGVAKAAPTDNWTGLHLPGISFPANGDGFTIEMFKPAVPGSHIGLQFAGGPVFSVYVEIVVLLNSTSFLETRRRNSGGVWSADYSIPYDDEAHRFIQVQRVDGDSLRVFASRDMITWNALYTFEQVESFSGDLYIQTGNWDGGSSTEHYAIVDNLNYIPDAPAISLHQATPSSLRIAVPDTSPAHRFELELDGIVVDSFAEAQGTSPTRYVEFTGLAEDTSYDVRVRYLGGFWSSTLTVSTEPPLPSLSSFSTDFSEGRPDWIVRSHSIVAFDNSMASIPMRNNWDEIFFRREVAPGSSGAAFDELTLDISSDVSDFVERGFTIAMNFVVDGDIDSSEPQTFILHMGDEVGGPNKLIWNWQGAGFPPYSEWPSTSYDPGQHRWLRLTPNSVSVSPDGVNWTVLEDRGAQYPEGREASFSVIAFDYNSSTPTGNILVHSINASPEPPPPVEGYEVGWGAIHI